MTLHGRMIATINLYSAANKQQPSTCRCVVTAYVTDLYRAAATKQLQLFPQCQLCCVVFLLYPEQLTPAMTDITC